MKKIYQKIKSITINHPIIAQFIACIIVGFILAILSIGYSLFKRTIIFEDNIGLEAITVFAEIPIATLIFAAIVYPIVVTIYEILFLVITAINDDLKVSRALSSIYDIFVVFVAIIYEFILLELIHNVVFEAEWYKELRNLELHTPISHQYSLTFLVLLFMFVLGIIILMVTEQSKRPPLVTVVGIAMMYIGVIEAILFTIQIFGMHLVKENEAFDFMFEPDLLFTLLVPFNMILITIRIILNEVKSYKVDENRKSKIDSVPFLGWCNRILNNSVTWPIVAFIMMIPVLGIIIAILTLFGQAPDAAIKAFTETANYTFSAKIPPQNVFYDEHYLCTVAAGGHERVVKPIRMGKRHGHDVVVNRQLCVANAFEQILEEKTPGFHRKLRAFYDRYGFPIARIIKTKIIADIIWFIMKPLEWFFLLVIYAIDVNPEDRIASQYL